MIDYPQPEQRPATLAERLRAAGISDDRALDVITKGRVRVDEDVETDPQAPVPWPTPWVMLPSS